MNTYEIRTCTKTCPIKDVLPGDPFVIFGPSNPAENHPSLVVAQEFEDGKCVAMCIDIVDGTIYYLDPSVEVVPVDLHIRAIHKSI